MKKNSSYWIGYADLMTTLFFVMLILAGVYMFNYVKVSQKVEQLETWEEQFGNLDNLQSRLDECDSIQAEYEVIKSKEDSIEAFLADKKQLDKIKQIEKALSQLDKKYFEYDETNKRFKLNIPVLFKKESSDINDLENQQDLLYAGQELYKKISNLTKTHPDVEYLMVIEGMAARGKEFQNHANFAYNLSYERSLALFSLWQEFGVDFYKLENCETLLCGSGFFGKSRSSKEEDNKKFTIQITSKIGQFVSDE